MKKNLIIHFILVLLLKIGVTGCTEETISMNVDRMPDETAMDNIAGALRNTTTLTNKAFIELAPSSNHDGVPPAAGGSGG